MDVRRLQPSYPIEVWNRSLEVAWRQCFPHPDFMAGLFEAVLRRTGVEPTVEVTRREPGGFDLELRW